MQAVRKHGCGAAQSRFSVFRRPQSQPERAASTKLKPPVSLPIRPV